MGLCETVVFLVSAPYNLMYSMTKNIYSKIGKGPNLIFLHGWGQNKESWGKVGEILSKKFTCWIVDLPGFGQNSKILTDQSPIGYARWVDEFTSTNKIHSFNVVGHSFGGRIAAILAADNKRVEKAVLYCAPLLKHSTNRIRLASLASKLGLKNVPYLSEFLRSDDYKKTDQANREVFLQAVNFDLTQCLKKISKPTLILAGERDSEVPLSIAQGAHLGIKNSGLYIFPNASHFPHLENPYLFCSVIQRFLEK